MYYFWLGKKVLKNNEHIKVVQLCVEYQSNIVFEIIFDSKELNDFIKCFSENIFSCLCLKTEERDFFESVCEESTSEIVSLNTFANCKKFITNFQIRKNIKFDSITEPNYIDILFYYNELILITQKLKSMCYQENGNPHIEAILQI